MERLAWRTMGGHSRAHNDNFDPVLLHASFERTIKDLKELNVEVSCINTCTSTPLHVEVVMLVVSVCLAGKLMGGDNHILVEYSSLY